MLVQNTDVRSLKECYKTRISYIERDNSISIEHFSEAGKLLSELKMDFDEAYEFARLIEEVADEAIGVE